MCKIVTFTNTKRLNIIKTSNTIGNILLKIEEDGFGYAIKGKSNIYGEKCIAPKFDSRLGKTLSAPDSIIKQHYQKIGVMDKPDGPGIFHGRTSTNDTGLLNCHPMIRDGWHLIHNGVVTDHGPTYQQNTTNDSEHVLYRLIQGIEQVEQHLTGYYAFACISPDGKLHIGKDKIASLFIAWSDQIDSFIIATTSSLLEDVAKHLKVKIEPISEVDDDIYMVFDGNRLIHRQSIKSRGYGVNESKFAVQSLGRSLDNDYQTYDYDRYYMDSIIDSIDDDRDDKFDDSYLQEIDSLDDTYTIYDHDDIKLSIDEFRQLDIISKARCLIIRADGSTLEPWDEAM